MAKSMAQVVMEKGRKRGRKQGLEKGLEKGRAQEALDTRQQTLLRQLAKRFGDLPAKSIAVVKASKSIEQLDNWLDRVVVAKQLDDMEIG